MWSWSTTLQLTSQQFNVIVPNLYIWLNELPDCAVFPLISAKFDYFLKCSIWIVCLFTSMFYFYRLSGFLHCSFCIVCLFSSIFYLCRCLFLLYSMMYSLLLLLCYILNSLFCSMSCILYLSCELSVSFFTD